MEIPINHKSRERDTIKNRGTCRIEVACYATPGAQGSCETCNRAVFETGTVQLTVSVLIKRAHYKLSLTAGFHYQHKHKHKHRSLYLTVKTALTQA